MFFAYPEDATSENWVHECLLAIVEDIHAKVESNKPSTAWPSCIPAAHRDKLENRPALKRLRGRYIRALKTLPPNERGLVLRCAHEQNQIPSLLAGTSQCERLGNLPEVMRPPIAELFEYGFELVKELGIRDRHYCAIYDKMAFHDCPFCGTEPFDAPIGTTPRLRPTRHISEDLDHYLPRKSYPFAAANLRNLVPAGRKCNGHKSETDIVLDAAGTRYVAFNPYSGPNIEVSLINSIPFGAADSELPAWHLTFVPQSAACDNWDRVYGIKGRWIDNDLSPHFKGWLEQFIAIAGPPTASIPITDNVVKDSLRDFYQREQITSRTGRERFRGKVIEMLLHHCEAGNRTLLDFMKGALELCVPSRTDGKPVP